MTRFTRMQVTATVLIAAAAAWFSPAAARQKFQRRLGRRPCGRNPGRNSYRRSGWWR